MKITTIGIDLAKNIFQIHGVDKHGKAALRKKIETSRDVTLLRQPAEIMGMRLVVGEQPA